MSKMECYATDFARKYFFFAALFCSCLGFNALHASPRYEGFSKGIQFKKGAINCCFVENRKTICQIVGSDQRFDLNSDRVSK